MMARKNGSKAESRSSIVFDTRTKAVMAAETQHDDVKGKVQSVREVVPGKSNNEIILVLQYYDNNVERTIQAYVEDGAKEALTQWHFSGNKTTNKRKKKNKPKPTNQQTQGKPSDQSQKANEDSNHIEQKSLTTQQLVNGSHEVHSNGDSTERTASSASTASSPVSSSSTEPLPPRQPLPQRQRQSQTGHSGTVAAAHPTHSTHHVRERTISEQSASSVSSTAVKTKKPHAGLEKSIKDLQRQTISIERYKRVLNEEVDKGCKRLKTVFEEMIQALKERESILQTEMEVVKKQALETFAMRQSQGADLKVRVDRAPSMSDAEVAELRSEIKHFVADRKLDEDLGKTTRFLYDSDHLLGEIKSFGEVVPVRCAYSKRRPSVSSLVSQTSEPAADLDTSPALATGGGASSSLTTTSSSSSSAPSREVIDVQEVADIQRRLKDSLRLQGVPVKSPPPRQGRQLTPSDQQRSGSGSQPRSGSGSQPRSGSGSQPRSGSGSQPRSGSGSQPRSGSGSQPRSGSGSQPRSGSGSQPRSGQLRSGSGDHERSKPGGQRSGPAQRSEGSGASSAQDEYKKNRNAKRRQRQRERQREMTNSSTAPGSNSPTHNSNRRQPAAKAAAPPAGPNHSDAQDQKGSSPETSPVSGISGPKQKPDISQDSVGDRHRDSRDRGTESPQSNDEHRNPKPVTDTRTKSPATIVTPRDPPASRNSATVSINGGGAMGEKSPVKRVEVIVNGNIHE